MAINNIIYALHVDGSQRVYVGKSTTGLARPRTHGAVSNVKKNPHFPVVRWLVKWRALGKTYDTCVLEECETPEALEEAERFHIAYLKSIGVLLLNLTDGGEGLLNPSQEVRQKMRAAWPPERRAQLAERNRKEYSPEIRTRMSVSANIRWASDQQRQMAADKQRGKKHSPETCAKIAANSKNISDDTRQKMSTAQIASWSPERKQLERERWTPERRVEVSEKQIGKKQSAETLEKKRIAREKRTDEQKAETARKYSTANTGRKRTSETCEKIRLARLGTTLSSETRAKISAIKRANFAARQEKKDKPSCV